MSSIKKIYRIIGKIKEITNRKSFSRFFVLFSAGILFFLTFNIYAQEDSNVISPDFEGEKEFHNIVNKVENKSEDNSVTGLAQQNVTSLWTSVVYLGGSDILDEETREELEGANVPYDLKRGLIGIADDTATTIYANYPLVDIPGHLAQQWVPGYKDATTALYAQEEIDTGYEELSASGIAPLWTKVLNVSYVFFVIIMMVAGFMIMFRQKLGGQTMVTLGNVLPKVIVSLIIATFSFAIAGFLIDLGGILISAIIYIFNINEPNTIARVAPIMGSVFRGGLGITTTIVGTLGSIGTVLGIGAILKSSLFVVGAAAPAAGLLFAAGVGVVALLFALTILVIIFVGAVKVVLTLLKSYLQLLLSVVLGPLQITLGALPGNSNAMKNWFLSVLRNVLVFPVVFFIVNIPVILQELESGVRLRLPGMLINEDIDYNAGGPDVTGGLFLGVIKIIVLYYAAQAPKFLESIFPPSSNKGLQEGFAGAKGSMSKIPLIGGFFKS